VQKALWSPREVRLRNAIMKDKTGVTLWTVGHSTRSIEDFVAILKSFDLQVLIDVRSFPGSRRYPHFNREHLRESLSSEGIEYVHAPELGGRRRARPDSHNLAWRNESFRGYADYMETESFLAAIERLVEIAKDRRAVVMCAEAVWWRCHRSLISDYLKVRGLNVLHIMDARKSEEHPFTSAARIVDGRLSYRGILESP
jgi:uncharacterized protein (DUF488 family)